MSTHPSMIRLRGDRGSLLAALLTHWSEQQLALPAPSRARPNLQLALAGRWQRQPLATMGRRTTAGRTP